MCARFKETKRAQTGPCALSGTWDALRKGGRGIQSKDVTEWQAKEDQAAPYIGRGNGMRFSVYHEVVSTVDRRRAAAGGVVVLLQKPVEALLYLAIKTFIWQDWGDGSVGNELAAQARGPEFRSPAYM